MGIKLELPKTVQLVQTFRDKILLLTEVENVFVRQTLNLAHGSENLLFKCNDLITTLS